MIYCIFLSLIDNLHAVSSTLQSHDPREIICNIRRMIDKEEPEEMHPFYVGWDGEIIPEMVKRKGVTLSKAKSNVSIIPYNSYHWSRMRFDK